MEGIEEFSGMSLKELGAEIRKYEKKLFRKDGQWRAKYKNRLGKSANAKSRDKTVRTTKKRRRRTDN